MWKTFAIALASLATFACQTPQDTHAEVSPAQAEATAPAALAAPDAPLDERLAFMLSEEKLARDLYLTLGERYPHRTFQNIPKSEQRHMDAVVRLLEARGLATDAAALPRGELAIPALQELHDALKVRGQASRLEALRVGALVEETDIEDLDEALALEGLPGDVREVFTKLRKASYNHLDGFVSAIEEEAGAYEPQVLDAARFTEARAVGAEHHRGRRHGGGHGSCEGEEH
jgi:hypothetical protein